MQKRVGAAADSFTSACPPTVSFRLSPSQEMHGSGLCRSREELEQQCYACYDMQALACVFTSHLKFALGVRETSR